MSVDNKTYDEATQVIERLPKEGDVSYEEAALVLERRWRTGQNYRSSDLLRIDLGDRGSKTTLVGHIKKFCLKNEQLLKQSLIPDDISRAVVLYREEEIKKATAHLIARIKMDEEATQDLNRALIQMEQECILKTQDLEKEKTTRIAAEEEARLTRVQLAERAQVFSIEIEQERMGKETALLEAQRWQLMYENSQVQLEGAVTADARSKERIAALQDEMAKLQAEAVEAKTLLAEKMRSIEEISHLKQALAVAQRHIPVNTPRNHRKKQKAEKGEPQIPV